MKKRIFSIRLQLIVIGCIVFAGGLFTACKKSNDNSGNTPVAALMAFNLAPDKSSIGIKLSGSDLVQTPLNYSGFTGSYLPVYPGNRTIEAFDSSNTSFSSSNNSFEEGKYYSLFVVGNNGSYSNLVVNDNFDSLSAGDQAYVRYINAIPDSSKPLVNITAGGNNVFHTNAAFSTVSEFASVPAGDLAISLTNESTINASRTISLEQKKVYTILLLGNPAATDSTGKVQIRFIENGGL